MCKKGQGLVMGRHMTGDPVVNAYTDLYNNRFAYGVAKGIRESIPLSIEYLPSIPLGVLNAVRGGSYQEGIEPWIKFVSPLTDRFRRLSMKMGGRHVKKLLNYDKDAIVRGLDRSKIDERGLAYMNAAESLGEGVGAMLVPTPPVSKAVKAIPAMKAVSNIAFKPMTDMRIGLPVTLGGITYDNIMNYINSPTLPDSDHKREVP